MSSPNPMEVLVTRILDGSAPAQAKSAAARGILPIPRTDLVKILVFLLKDSSEEIRQAADTSLATMPVAAIESVLSDEDVAPEVLTHFSRVAVKDGITIYAEKIAFNKAASGESIEILAAAGNDEMISLVLTNQERLTSSPNLLDLLLGNTAARADQKSLIQEIKARLDRLAAKETAPPPEGAEGTDDTVDEEQPDEDELTVEDVARILNVDVGELLTASEIAGGHEFEEEDVPQEVRGAYQKIMTLNTSQKAIMAIKGGREERSILIRDTNRLVALAVLKNPRLPEGEVESIAGMRNVHEAVLRYIGAFREWTKNYNIAVALVRNPRTPQGVSTNFINRLNNRDLKFLSRDKNVPELIRRMSKRTLDQREQKSKVSFKKH
jgi:hypothetical protein